MILRRRPGKPRKRFFGPYNIWQGHNGVSGVQKEQPEWWEKHCYNDHVRFTFDRFAAIHGQAHCNAFAVDVEWRDVIEVINRFADHGHPEAQLLRARRDGASG